MNRDHLTRRQTISLATATAAASLFPARAEAAWPNKAIRFVVPFAPGGSSEIVARATAAELAKLLGQSVFVDNKPGGAGNVAMGEVARADDQHTLILGHIGTLAVNPFIFDKLPYDLAKGVRASIHRESSVSNKKFTTSKFKWGQHHYLKVKRVPEHEGM